MLYFNINIYQALNTRVTDITDTSQFHISNIAFSHDTLIEYRFNVSLNSNIPKIRKQKIDLCLRKCKTLNLNSTPPRVQEHKRKHAPVEIGVIHVWF